MGFAVVAANPIFVYCCIQLQFPEIPYPGPQQKNSPWEWATRNRSNYKLKIVQIVVFIRSPWDEISAKGAKIIANEIKKKIQFILYLFCVILVNHEWRRRRDSNPRTAFDGYTISNRARSTSYATSPQISD